MAEYRIYLAVYKNQQRVFVNTGISGFFIKAGNFSTSSATIDF